MRYAFPSKRVNRDVDFAVNPVINNVSYYLIEQSRLWVDRMNN